jgi:hypothetical protein
VDIPLQSSPHNYQQQLALPNQNSEHLHPQGFPNNRYQQQQQMPFKGPPDSQHINRETG